MFNFKHRKQKQVNPSKLNDTGIICSYIDVCPNEKFQHPILPLPLRIDKIQQGKMTFFILPDQIQPILIGEKQYILNLSNIFTQIIQNLLDYAKYYFSHHTVQGLTSKRIGEWWKKSYTKTIMIKSFKEDANYVFHEFAKRVSEGISLKTELSVVLKDYITDLISFFNSRIENGEITTFFRGEESNQLMYKKKKDKIYPEIVQFDISSIDSQKKKIGRFVPLLIYDDLLECLLHNQNYLNDDNTTQLTYDYILNKYFLIVDDGVIPTFTMQEFIQNHNIHTL